MSLKSSSQTTIIKRNLVSLEESQILVQRTGKTKQELKCLSYLQDHRLTNQEGGYVSENECIIINVLNKSLFLMDSL